MGWYIEVFRQANGGLNPAPFGAPRGARLAKWKEGMFGLGWHNDLVEQGMATKLHGDGYPLEFSAVAAAVMPRLPTEENLRRQIADFTTACTKEGLCYDGDEEWIDAIVRSDTEVDLTLITSLKPTEWLIVEAWDRS